MKINILVPEFHWLGATAHGIIAEIEELDHRGQLFHSIESLTKGDILLALGWPKKLTERDLSLHHYNLIPHASELPENRGWSPWVWTLIEGSDTITLSWIEAAFEIDSGVIYSQEQIRLDGSELLPEIRAKLASLILASAVSLIRRFPNSLSSPRKQIGLPTYRRRRVPKDSEIDPLISISEQFNLLRTVDNQDYPAFFYFRGGKYKLTIEAVEET